MVFSAIPPAIATSFYLPALVYFAVLIQGPRPAKNATVYLGAALGVTLAVGLVLVPVLKETGIYSGHHGKTVRPWVDIITGVLLILLAVILTRHPIRIKPKAAKRRELTPLVVLLIGIAMYRPSFLYLTSLNEIAKSQIGIGQAIINTVVISLIVVLPLECAMAAYLLSAERAADWLKNVDHWLTNHLKVITVLLSAGFGIFLLVRGLVHL